MITKLLQSNISESSIRSIAIFDDVSKFEAFKTSVLNNYTGSWDDIDNKQSEKDKVDVGGSDREGSLKNDSQTKSNSRSELRGNLRTATYDDAYERERFPATQLWADKKNEINNKSSSFDSFEEQMLGNLVELDTTMERPVITHESDTNITNLRTRCWINELRANNSINLIDEDSTTYHSHTYKYKNFGQRVTYEETHSSNGSILHNLKNECSNSDYEIKTSDSYEIYSRDGWPSIMNSLALSDTLSITSKISKLQTTLSSSDQDIICPKCNYKGNISSMREHLIDNETQTSEFQFVSTEDYDAMKRQRNLAAKAALAYKIDLENADNLIKCLCPDTN